MYTIDFISFHSQNRCSLPHWDTSLSTSGGEAFILRGGGLYGAGEYLLDGWGEMAQEVMARDGRFPWWGTPQNGSTWIKMDGWWIYFMGNPMNIPMWMITGGTSMTFKTSI